MNSVKKVVGTSVMVVVGVPMAVNKFGFVTSSSDSSMSPNISSSDNLMVHRTDSFKSGDIVVTKCPNNPNQSKYFSRASLEFSFILDVEVCRRVAAVGGEVKVFKTEEGGIIRRRIPLNHVWLLGDSQEQTGPDSRDFGPVNVGLLEGKVYCRMNMHVSPHFEIVSHELRPNSKVVRPSEVQDRRDPLALAKAFFNRQLSSNTASYVSPRIQSSNVNSVMASPNEQAKK